LLKGLHRINNNNNNSAAAEMAASGKH